MLYITIPAREIFDPNTESFLYTKEQKLQLEHSLVSISKWEAKWKKPFLSDKNKTVEETRDYIRCMTITQNVDPNVYLGLTPDLFKQVMAYIDDTMTATTFSNEDPSRRKSPQSFITSELIYYWMVKAQIPWEAEKWHLNRLLTLLHVYNNKEQPAKKMSRQDRKALMESRRAKTRARHPHK